jgi:hypothetical protein
MAINDVIVALPGLAIVAGCSASSGGDSVGGGAAMGPPADTVAADCDGKLACDPAGEGEAPGSVCVQTVDARLVSLDGSPVPDTMVTVCGKNLCAKGKSNTSGDVHVAVCHSVVEPAFELEGGARYVTFAVPISRSISSIGALTLVPLPAEGDDLAAAAHAGAAVQSEGIRLTFAAGTEVAFDIADAFDADAQRFRAVMVPRDKAPPSAQTASGMDFVVGIAPVRAALSSPARLTVPNSAGWAPGAAVRLFQHGVDPLGEGPAPFGRWTEAGTARVSDDGATIATDEASGLIYLAPIGLGRL